MTVVKLFNGEEVTRDLFEGYNAELIIAHITDAQPKRKVIQKQKIFSIEF